MHKLFIEEYGDYAKWLTQRKFTTWMEAYGKNSGYKVTQGKSGALRWIHFDDGKGPMGGVDIDEEEAF
jgi:hypothetical protein